MRFKIDENLPVEAGALLNDAGHDAVTVNDQDLSGATDTNGYRACVAEQRTFVTLDTDFANIQSYPPSDSSGVIVLRLARQDKAHVLASVRRIIRALLRESPERQLWIVEDIRIRIRG